MSSEFPAEPTLAATVEQTGLGQYGATLTLPDGQERVFAGAELDSVRARVLGDARHYLATEVGHPGRLEVTDPDGTWMLGIPHDGGQPVALDQAPAEVHAPRVAAPDPTTSAATVLLPSRPAIPTRRHRPFGRSRSHRPWSLGGRGRPAVALLAASILTLVLIRALDHTATTVARHTKAAQKADAPAGSQPTTVPKPKSKPTPRTRPARHRPTSAPVLDHKPTAATTRPSAAHATHHPVVVHHRSTVASSAPAVSSTPAAPVVTQTPPVQAPARAEPTHTTTTSPLPTLSGPPPL